MADTENGTGQTPPWGDDFDAETAWRLVQNLRSEVSDLKTAKSTLKAELDAQKAESGSGADKIAAAEARAKDAEKALHVERAIRKYPALEEYADLLSGDTEEEILAKAERLAKIGQPKAPEGDQKPGDGDEKPEGEQKPEGETPEGEQKPEGEAGGEGLPGKPAPSLTPGHGGQDPEPFDPVAIARAARR
jgi:hypothetical protein